MGTNYYAIPNSRIEKWESRRKKSLEEAKDMKGLIPQIEEYYASRYPSKIHIGKASFGWKFCWNLNNKQYYSNKEELINFLKNSEIKDEYDTIFTFEEFWYTAFTKRENLMEYLNVTDFPEMYILIDGMEFIDSEFC